MKEPAQWNGDPEFKPDDWVDLPGPRIIPWNGPIEFKPDDWEERQLAEHRFRQSQARRR